MSERKFMRKSEGGREVAPIVPFTSPTISLRPTDVRAMRNDRTNERTNCTWEKKRNAAQRSLIGRIGKLYPRNHYAYARSLYGAIRARGQR